MKKALGDFSRDVQRLLHNRVSYDSDGRSLCSAIFVCMV